MFKTFCPAAPPLLTDLLRDILMNLSGYLPILINLYHNGERATYFDVFVSWRFSLCCFSISFLGFLINLYHNYREMGNIFGCFCKLEI